MIKRLPLIILISAAILLGSNITFASEKPEIFVQLGHARGIYSVSFSPDGKYALSGSADNTLKLWEISTGRELRTFKGHTHNISSVTFSPDGRYALSGSEDKTLKLWDIATWREIRTFKGHSKEVNSAVFSADGRYILSSSKDGTVKLWDASTGMEIRTFTYIGEEFVTQPDGRPDKIKVIGTRSRESAVFSPDRKYVLSGGEEGIKLWDVATGKEMRQFTDSGHNSKIAISPDGKYILSVRFKTLKLWNVETGKEIWTSVELSNFISAMAFSPDGKYVLSGTQEGSLKLWEIMTGKEIRTFAEDSSYINSVAFSPDGRYALSGSMQEGAIKIWDVETGKEIKTLGKEVYSVSSVTFTKDGRNVLAGNGPTLCLWDILSGKKIRTFAGNYPLALSPDGRHALSGSEDKKTLKLWDVATGKEMRQFTGHTGSVYSVTFSPDGRYVLSASGDNTVRLWEAATGKMIRTILGSGSKGGSFGYLALFPDGRSFMSTYTDSSNPFNPITTFRLFDIATGREIKSFPRGAWGMSVSPDGRYLFSNRFELVDINSGRVVRVFSPKGYAAESTFSPDGNYLLTTGERALLLWDVATGGIIKEFKGHIDNTWFASFSPDTGYVVSGGADNTIRLWNVSTGKELAQFISFTDGEWIVITPEGYYNSSANGDKHLNVRIGNNVYGVDQYRSAFYKPQIIEAALRLGDTQKAVAEVLGSEKEKPTVATIQNIEPPFVVIKSPEDGKRCASDSAELSLYIEDRNQTIKSVKVYVNGRTVTGSEIASASPRNGSRGVKITPKGVEVPEGRKTLDIMTPIKLEGGENLIEVIAFNGYSEGRRAIRLYSEVKAAKAGEVILPNLWVLSVGINKYQDKNLTPLSYAVADAEGIVEAFKRQKGRLFREINSLIISDSSSIKPTYDSILDNLSYLSKASANDIVLLFIAGHGINDDKGDFYFLPADAVIMNDGAIKKSKAIPWRELKAILELPSKKLIFADTCHSEGVSGKKTRGVDNDRFVKELQEANAVIFTSSRGKELSQESDKWKHGAFTYAIIEGINGKADLIKDNKISMKELDTYVSETVPQITNGTQHPITNTPDGYVNFPVAVLE